MTDAKDCAFLSSINHVDKYNLTLMAYRKGYFAASEEASSLLEEIKELKDKIKALENKIKELRE